MLACQADALLAERRIEAALALYEQAVEAGLPFEECAEARWTGAMLLGRFDEAWAVSDRILAARIAAGPCWHLPRHHQWVWNGRTLSGTRVLVRCYHGLGDTIHFVRFMPPLKRIAAETILWAQPALLPLLSSAKGIDRLIPLHDGTPEAEWDADIELMELPHALRISPGTLPPSAPYLHAPRRRLPPALLNVGLVWAAGDWDTRRSVPLELLAQLGDIQGIALWSLQRGPAQRDLLRTGAPAVANPEDMSADVMATASLIRGLDLVVTVDTMVAHLAGALGVSVWTLLHFAADWRWGLGSERTPWYPTMRLFRQEGPGDWHGVVAKVAQALRGLRIDAGR